MSPVEKTFIAFAVMMALALAAAAYFFLSTPEPNTLPAPPVEGMRKASGRESPGPNTSVEKPPAAPGTGKTEKTASAGSTAKKESLAPRAVDVNRFAQVVGRVLDAEKQPVAGAEVILYREIHPPRRVDRPLHKENLLLRAVTNAQGRYFFQTVPAPGFYEITAIAQGLAPLERPKVTVKPSILCTAPDLLMGEGWTLRGVVRNEAGTPLEGAKVFLDRGVPMGNPMEWERDPTGSPGAQEEGRREAESLPWQARTETDASGRFTFPAVGAGFYEVSTWAQGYALVVKKADTGKVSAGREIALEFVLEREKEIRGMVTDKDHRPLGGVRIRAALDGARNALSRGRALTDPKEGRFVLKNLRPGRYILSARKEGYLPAFASNVQAGTRNVRIVMKRAAAVTGRVVVAKTGKPMQEFLVGVYADRAMRPGAPRPMVRAWERIRDPEGRFRVEGLQRGRYVVAVRAEGYTDGYSDPLALEEEAVGGPVTISLERGFVLTGEVIDAHGRPVAGARVELVPGAFRPDLMPGISSIFSKVEGISPSETPLNRIALTDGKGRFRIADAEPGTYCLCVTHPEYKEGVLPGVTVDRKDLNRAGRVMLEKGGTLSCTVYGPDGTALAGRLVSVTGLDPKSFALARTDGEGRFRMVHMTPGSYELTLPGGGWIPLGGGASTPPPRENKLNVVIAEGEETKVEFHAR